MHELRENDDGTVSVLGVRGEELIRGKAPPGGRTGLDGIRAMQHQKAKPVLRCLKNNTRFFKRAVNLETFEAADLGDGAIMVTATWRNGGAWNKEYTLADMPPACGMKRLLLKDLLGARGIS